MIRTQFLFIFLLLTGTCNLPVHAGFVAGFSEKGPPGRFTADNTSSFGNQDLVMSTLAN